MSDIADFVTLLPITRDHSVLKVPDGNLASPIVVLACCSDGVPRPMSQGQRRAIIRSRLRLPRSMKVVQLICNHRVLVRFDRGHQ